MRVSKQAMEGIERAEAEGRIVQFPSIANVNSCFIGLVAGYTITIPNFTPTPLNKLLAMHWAKRGREKKIAADLVKAYAVMAEVPPAKCRRAVEMIFTGWQRGQGGGNLPDSDALEKVARDALVAAGMLVDDSEKWALFMPSVILRGPKRTVIRLYDLDKEPK